MSAALDLTLTSTPTLTEFDPREVPYQFDVVRDVRRNWDYLDRDGNPGVVHEFLLSGSVGSAKSILLAHLGLTHALMYPGSRGAICRKAMPDLKKTILVKLFEHMGNDLIEGDDYEFNRSLGLFTFSNRSEIILHSWADKNFKKIRSAELSWAAVEELTENDDAFKGFYPELRMRVGRLPHIPESWVGCATNPDSPAHWAHKYFIKSPSPTRHVYYSRTTDNKFLPPEYIEGLKRDLDPKLAKRMLEGLWVEISQEVVYHQYGAENFRDRSYQVRTVYPIRLMFDFNIGAGKPMSACAGQYAEDRDEWHFFKDYIVEGADTEALCHEIEGQGLFEHRAHFIVHGDATGKHRDTRSKRSDYDIIEKFLANYRRKDGSAISFEMQVPPSNPPVRARHNQVNAYMHNAEGIRRMFVYKDAPTLDEGFRLVKLRPGANYVEDDTPAYQHVTTAAGYGITSRDRFKQSKSSSREW